MGCSSAAQQPGATYPPNPQREGVSHVIVRAMVGLEVRVLLVVTEGEPSAWGLDIMELDEVEVVISQRLESAAAVYPKIKEREDGALAEAMIATTGHIAAGVFHGRRTAHTESDNPQRTFLEPRLGATTAKTPQGNVPIDVATRELHT